MFDMCAGGQSYHQPILWAWSTRLLQDPDPQEGKVATWSQLCDRRQVRAYSYMNHTVSPVSFFLPFFLG